MPADQPQVAHDQEHADGRGDGEGGVDVDVVHQVGEQQVEGEEGGRARKK